MSIIKFPKEKVIEKRMEETYDKLLKKIIEFNLAMVMNIHRYELTDKKRIFKRISLKMKKMSYMRKIKKLEDHLHTIQWLAILRGYDAETMKKFNNHRHK